MCFLHYIAPRYLLRNSSAGPPMLQADLFEQFGWQSSCVDSSDARMRSGCVFDAGEVGATSAALGLTGLRAG
jgi:hypothetical protein